LSVRWNAALLFGIVTVGLACSASSTDHPDETAARRACEAFTPEAQPLRARAVEDCTRHLTAPGVSLDAPAALTQCAELRRGPEADNPFNDGRCVLPRGTQPIGTPCATGLQCASGACSLEGNVASASGAQFCGSCVPPRPAQCIQSYEACGSAGGCSLKAETCEVQTQRGVGERCSPGDCKLGLRCRIESKEGAPAGSGYGRCIAPLGPGERCADELNSHLPCVTGYDCNGETCMPTFGEGEPCNWAPTQRRACGRDLRCEGEPPRCVRNVPLAMGEMCLNKGPCADGICDSTTFHCVPTPPLGDPRACR